MKIIDATKKLNTHEKQIIVTTLKQNGLIIYPTETCYGIGANATSTQAVEKLWAYKGGRGKKAVSIMVNSMRMASEYVEINHNAKHLYEEFLPGPITVISKSMGKVVPQIESERHTLGVRIPDHPIPLAISKAYGIPITATSANTSGKKSPYSFEEWQKYTSPAKQKLIDVFINAGKLPLNEPSTVVDTTLSELNIVRQGSVDLGNSGDQKYVSHSLAQTNRLAKKLFLVKIAPHLEKEAVIIALSGDLGAGKTHFTQGLAKALDIKQQVVSPTYQVIREYEYDCGKLSGKVGKSGGKLRGKLIHIDTWRLHSPDELSEFKVDKYLKAGNIIVIEWPEKVDSWIKSREITCISITITGMGDETREVSIISQ